MHQCIKFILFWNDTVHVSEVFPSIIRSSRLYIQQYLFENCMYSLELLMMNGKTVRNMYSVIPNRHLSNRYCCLLDCKQTAVSVWLLYVQSLSWNDTVHFSDGLSVHHQEFQDCTYSCVHTRDVETVVSPWLIAQNTD